MTEEEWDSITDWSLLLMMQRRRHYPERKFLLLASAFLRRVESQLSQALMNRLATIEAAVEGTTNRGAIIRAIRLLAPPGWLVHKEVFDDAVARWVADETRRLAADSPAEYVFQAALFRDIFGNPFRPVTFDPNWRTSTVVALAQQMYESRDFSPMPVLADALQDAGCEHPDVLDHCRGAGPHVRGCWVVDLILGKQ